MAPKALTPRPYYRPRGTLYISGREGGQFLEIKPCYQRSDQQTETSHPPLGPGLVPGLQMKGFPLALFTSCQTLKIQPLYFGNPCTTLRGPGTGPGVWAPAQGSVPGLVARTHVKHYHCTRISTYGRIMYHFYHISHVLAYWAVIGCIAAGGLPDMISL